jgi:hypothetical protein
MGRPPRKTAYVVAKAQRKGTLQAELEMHRKKPLLESTKEHIGHILDNTKIMDLAELAAALGITFVVHDLIIGTDVLIQKVAKNYNSMTNVFSDLTGVPVIGGILGELSIPTDTILTLLGVNLSVAPPKRPGYVQVPEKAPETSAEPDTQFQIFTWLISFSLAYIIVRHAGQLIGLLDKGIGSVLGLLMGAV